MQWQLTAGEIKEVNRYLDWRDAFAAANRFRSIFVAMTSFLRNFRNFWTILGESQRIGIKLTSITIWRAPGAPRLAVEQYLEQ